MYPKSQNDRALQGLRVGFVWASYGFHRAFARAWQRLHGGFMGSLWWLCGDFAVDLQLLGRGLAGA